MSHECGGAVVFEDVDQMIRQAWPDRVIVTTVDGYCHDHIIRRLEAGCDAISEKPVTIGERKCQAILVAEQRTGSKVIVTFSYRFAPCGRGSRNSRRREASAGC